MNRSERRDAARKSRKAASRTAPVVAQTPQTPAALCTAGLNHLQAGRRLDAQMCCQQALAIDAGHADSLHLMGLLSFDSGNYDHALEWVVRAIRQNQQPNYRSTLGATL